ncbi:hypothetical protein GCM10023347_46470 [Streptomyces chumphonensis]|uniref:DUF45 domain-containing protein n=1 Tax=Streptomyces chumphonensis TaxID=1214925 RepID=A0A927EZX8_9ACTN|nr:YgjP-like metallopeptidase domain-containing protein [Streptomyces chumphonensis]MBD3932823.1 DUF45 domain-containing protein [Streptomyces chumphonensis]
MSTTAVDCQQAIAALPVPADWNWEVVVRPRRRSLGINVTANGGVVFAVPPDADPHAVASAVRARMPRLAEQVRRRGSTSGEPVKELVGGTGFAYLGRRHRLKLVPRSSGRQVRLHLGWLELPEPDTAGEGGDALAAWYTARGTRWLAARAPSMAGVLGVAPTSVAARDLGRHWGACASSGSVTVHWAVMQLPSLLVDLVLAHELCHLTVSGHGTAFQKELRRVLPDAHDRERRFASEEPRLWRGSVC